MVVVVVVVVFIGVVLEPARSDLRQLAARRAAAGCGIAAGGAERERENQVGFGDKAAPGL